MENNFNIDNVDRVAKIANAEGTAIVFFAIVMIVFLVFMMILAFKLPKVIGSYLDEKNNIRKGEIKRDENRWSKHMEITERAVGVESQNIEIMFHVRKELETVGEEMKKVAHQCTHNKEKFDQVCSNQSAIRQMLLEVYEKIEESKRVQAEEKEIKKVTLEMVELKNKLEEMTEQLREDNKDGY